MMDKSDKVVTTYNGTTALRRHCRYIKGHYYIMNKQCFKIAPENKWYRVDSGKIFLNHLTGVWEKKSNYLAIQHDIIVDEKGEFRVVDIGIIKRPLSSRTGGKKDELLTDVRILIPIKLNKTTIREIREIILKSKFRDEILKKEKLPNDITNLIYGREFIDLLFKYHRKVFLEIADKVSKIFNIDWNYFTSTRSDSINLVSYEEKLKYILMADMLCLHPIFGIFDRPLMENVLPSRFRELIKQKSLLDETLYMWVSFTVTTNKTSFSNLANFSVNRDKYKKILNVSSVDSRGYVATIDGVHDDVPDSKDKRLLYTFLAKCLYFYSIQGDQYFDSNTRIAFNIPYCPIPYNRVYMNGDIGEVNYVAKHLIKRVTSNTKLMQKLLNNLPEVYFINDNVKSIFNNFGFSVGIEYETSGGVIIREGNRLPTVFSRGIIPENDLYESGLLPTRDGSISGIEYVSIPMRKDIPRLLYKQLQVLRSNTCVTSTDSLHVHIGTIPHFDYKFVVAMYKLGLIIENDIYKMFPSLYRKTGAFKRRDYNNPLLRGSNNGDELFDPEVNDISKMAHIYKWLGGDQAYIPITTSSKGAVFNIEMLSVHPSDPEGNRKWHIEGRYTWCNFIPLIWNSADYRSIEFRVHTPTLSMNKIMYWLLILRGIVLYADKYKIELLHLTERNVLGRVREKLKFIITQVYSPDVADLINSYIDWRSSIMSNDKTGRKELINHPEVPDDLKLIME